MILSPRRDGVASGGSTSNWVDHFNGGRSGIALMVDDRRGSQARGQFDNALCRKLKGIEDSLKSVILEASTDMSSGRGGADVIKTLRARADIGFTRSTGSNLAMWQSKVRMKRDFSLYKFVSDNDLDKLCVKFADWQSCFLVILSLKQPAIL